MKKKFLAIIPARYASTRLPGKLLISILGKSLIQRTIENAKKMTFLSKLLIATDDIRIFDHVHSLGHEAIMTSNCLTGTDRLAEVLSLYPQLQNMDAIVNLQGDEPFVDPRAVKQAIQVLLEDPLAQMSTLISPLTNKEDALSPSIVKCVINKKNDALYFSRTLIPFNKNQTFQNQTTYYRHIGLYVYRPAFLMTYQKLPATPLQLQEDLEQLKVLEHGYRIKVAITSHPSIGVDILEDIQKLEEWICQ